MTRDEVKQLLATIAVAYPNWKPESLEGTLTLWAFMLEPYDKNMMFAALKAFILTDTKGFAPSIGQLISHISAADGNPTAAEAWAIVWRCVQNSIYNAKENFDRLPPAIQRAVGSADILRQWAMSDGAVTVIESQFKRAYNAEILSQRETAMLPPELRTSLETANRRLALGDTV